MRLDIEVTCRRCGATFTPHPDDYVHGTWRICPRCRLGAPGKARGINPHNEPVQRVTGLHSAQDDDDAR